MVIEDLLNDALQELKRLRIDEGPSDENRKAQWYTQQAINELNPETVPVEPGPDVPPTAEEAPSGEAPPDGQDSGEEGSVSSEEGSATAGAASGESAEASPTGPVEPTPIVGTTPGAFSGEPSGD